MNKLFLKVIIITVLSIFLIGCDKTLKGTCVEGDCKSGHGTMVLSNGGKYVGQWKDGVPNGQGIVTINQISYKMEGQFKDGELNGEGIVTWRHGAKYTGQLKNSKREGFGIFIEPVGRKYEGNWKNDRKDGQGTMTYSNGEKYIGQFKNGFKEGHGILYDSNGKIIYNGLWKGEKVCVEDHCQNVVCVEGNCQNGKGYWIYYNDSKYIGQFKDGKQDGQGILYHYDGKIIYDGLWKNGRPHGQGISYNPDGKKYIGLFENGRMTKGIVYNSDGTIYHKGLWKDGEPVK